MNNFLEEYSGYNSTLYLVFPLLKNTIGLKCKLQAIKKKNYKLYDTNIIWYNLNDNKILNYVQGGSKGIKIHYFWLSNELLKPEKNFGISISGSGRYPIDFDKVVGDYNEKFKTKYKTNEVVIFMLYVSNKFVWDDEKLVSFLEELERDYFLCQDQEIPCSECKYRFLKNLTRKCDYLYVKTNFSVRAIGENE